MGKVIAYLKKDRGGTNFSKIFSKIPKQFYEKMGFALALLMMDILIVEEVLMVFFRNSVYIRLYYLIGAVGVVFSIFSILSFFYGEEKPSFREIIKCHIWDLALPVMLLWSCVSTGLSENREAALHGVFMRHDGLDSYFIYAGMYVCVRAVKNDKLRLWLIRSFAIIVSLLSIVSIPQTSMELMSRLGGIGSNLREYCVLYASVYLNTNHFGYMLTMGLLALACLVIIEKKLIMKIGALILYGFNLWALIINDTFGCYVAVMIGIIFIAVIMLVNDRERYKAVIAVLTVFAAVSVGMNTYNHGIAENFGITYDDFKTVSYNDAGGSGRIGLWKQAIKYIGEKPIFGFGPEGLSSRYYEDGFFNDRPHNEYIQHAAFLGIPGLLFYLTAIVGIFLSCIKRLKYLKPVTLAAGGIVFGYCVSAFFGNTLYNTTPYYFMFLGMVSACYHDFKK